MNSAQYIFGLVKGLHDLFTVLWIGGLFTTGLVVMPVMKQNLKKASN